MSSFSEANQAKLALKMNLSNYAWYHGIAVEADGQDWCVLVRVDHMDTAVRKIIPMIHNGIVIKVDIASKHLKKK